MRGGERRGCCLFYSILGFTLNLCHSRYFSAAGDNCSKSATTSRSWKAAAAGLSSQLHYNSGDRPPPLLAYNHQHPRAFVN